MPVSSGSYSFQSIKAELIIRKAYELINVPLSMLTSDQYDSAKNAINFILTDWFNQNVNLWSLQLNSISLIPNQANYLLPSNIQKISQVFLRTSIRQNFGGQPYATSGDAANAFDDNLSTACTQTESNGSIGYIYPTPQIINILGVMSNIEATYELTFSGLDKKDSNVLFTKKLPSTNFKKGITQWFSFDDDPLFYEYYQIEETGGATLDITELYFNNQTQDTTMSEVSRYEYLSYPNKRSIGRPTVYYVDYQITPSLYLWQTPSPTYGLIMYSGQSLIQTLESYTETINIPSVFYMPLVYGLAETLANQYAPEKADSLKMRYNEYMDRAVINNNAEVPLTLGVYSD
jgi:hypothetical protein